VRGGQFIALTGVVVCGWLILGLLGVSLSAFYIQNACPYKPMWPIKYIIVRSLSGPMSLMATVRVDDCATD
jgi:hypothetical protein